MKNKISWKRILYIAGVVALIVGAIDPLEGSVLIVAGVATLAFITMLNKDRHRKYFLAAFLMIIAGVISLFYLSSLGGFGGDSGLSWWWSSFIVPYPLGWLLCVVLLIIRAARKKNLQSA